MEAGNRALNAVFGSKLAAKGKSLAELLQPHSVGKCSVHLVHLFFVYLVSVLTPPPPQKKITRKTKTNILNPAPESRP